MGYKANFDIAQVFGTKQDRVDSFNEMMKEVYEQYKEKRRVSRREPLLGSWKREGADQCSIMFRREIVMANIFGQQYDHHLEWDRSNQITSEVGAESIWLYISYMSPRSGSMMKPIPKDSPIITQVVKRVAYAVKWMDELNEAFYYLANKYKGKYGIPILMFSLSSRSSSIECLTLDYEKKVNETQTAYERYVDYLVECMARRTSSSAGALTSLVGQDQAREYVKAVTDAAINEAAKSRYKKTQLELPIFQDEFDNDNQSHGDQE